MVGQGNKGTEVRAVRIPRNIGTILENEAKDQRVTVNSLINVVLKKNIEFDRFADKIGFVSLPLATFKAIVQQLDDEAVERLGKQLGATIPRETIMFFFKEVTVPTFLAWVDVFSRYYKLGKHDVIVDSGAYTISLHHELGAKWSTFLKSYFCETLKAGLEINAQCTVLGNGVTFKFRDPTFKPWKDESEP